MAKKVLIAVVVFYLLGVFGVAGGYLAGGWDSEWGLSAQILDAVKMGAAWPLVMTELIVGA